jgi:hypothetical protein
MKYYIDFGGYCEIEANSEEEAKRNFWERVNEGSPLPSNIYEIQGVERKED